jgi:hypothetical protein
MENVMSEAEPSDEPESEAAADTAQEPLRKWSAGPPTECNVRQRNGTYCHRPTVPKLDKCSRHRPGAVERTRAAGRLGGRASGEKRGRVAAARARVAVAAEQAGIPQLVGGVGVANEVRRLLGVAADLVLSGAPACAARATSLVGICKTLIELRSEVEREEEHQRLVRRAEEVLRSQHEGRRFAIVDGLAGTE